MAVPKPRRNRTDTVGRFGVFDVLRHRMTDGTGRSLRDVFTFACPDWVSIVPVTDAGQIVLVRQYRHGIDGETLEIPGGVIDAGEAPEAAALRELKEETGYEVTEIESLGFAHPNPPLQNNRHFMFLARGARAGGSPRFDPDEYCEVVLAPIAAVRRFATDGTMTHALVLLAMHRAFEVLEPGGS
jgi:ADP-ribose diphosphatase